MKTSASAALGALALALVAGGLAAQQQAPAPKQDAPESILPPGFNDPVTPAPTPSPVGVPTTGAPATLLPIDGATPSPTPTPTDTPLSIDLSAYELPSYARRSLGDVGAIGADSGGVGTNAWGRSDGVAIERLMRRLDAPLPSRWLSIALRRALVSRTAPPPGVNGVDFAAERAWLLLRMGEADMARALVQSVDVENYTPKLFQVAMQAMLANGDPAGLCPLVEPATRVSAELGWSFARAMCAALAGKPGEAGQLLDSARRGTGRSIDALLAEKVVGAGAQGRRAVTIEWDGVDRLTAWRYGLATATGVAIPNPLMDAAGAQVAGWRATSPMLGPVERAASADVAASQGVLSSLALVDLYGEIDASDDSGSAAGATARDLATAFTDSSADDRLGGLRQLWDAPTTPPARYARLVLTARAAARIAPDAARVADADRLIASMLTAGLDTAAARWRSVVPAGGDGWAMLALTDPAGGRVPAGDVRQVGADDPERIKTKLLVAGLAGLGRLSEGDAEALAREFDVQVGATNSWVRAINGAASRREAGTVLLLVAVGMQTTSWRGVPPEVLFHGVAALRAIGMEGEARMIAAEAIARL